MNKSKIYAVILAAAMLGGCSVRSSAANSESSMLSSESSLSTSSAVGEPGKTESSREYYGDGFISYIPVVSAMDVLDIRLIEDAVTIPEINKKSTVMRCLLELNGTVYALLSLHNYGKPAAGDALEYGLFNFSDQSYTTIIKAEDYGGFLENCSYSEGYLFFTTGGDSACVFLDLNSDLDITKLKTIKVGGGLSDGHFGFVGGDGLFYFEAAVLEPYSRGIYSMDPDSGEIKKIVDDGHQPFRFKDDVFYYVGMFGNKTIKSISGKYAFDEDEVSLIDENNILLLKKAAVNGKAGTLLRNGITGEKLFAVEGDLDRREHNDDFVNIWYDNNGRLTYDISLNVLIEYDERYEHLQKPEWKTMDFGIIRKFSVDHYEYYMVTRKK